jgi:hypothetical protein
VGYRLANDHSTRREYRTGTREVTNWATITNLRMDPYERAMEEGGESLKVWLLVPVQQKIKQFFKDYDAFPHREGSSLNAGGIGDGSESAAPVFVWFANS